jgi:starch synthase (maltosyl-transferring)
LLKADAADVRGAEHGVVVLINTDDRRPRPIPASLDPLDSEAGTALGHPQRLDGGVEHAPLAPGEVRIVSVERTQPVGDKSPRNGRALTEATKAPRVVIDRVDPHVEGGPFAVKRVIGQPVTVEADVFTDGHDLLGAELLWRAADEKDWKCGPLTPVGNDRWRGTFTPTRIGRHLFTVEAWRDDFGTLCRDIELKAKAGVDVALELVEARQHLESVLAQAVPCNTTAIRNVLSVLAAGDPAASVEALISPQTRAAVAASDRARSRHGMRRSRSTSSGRRRSSRAGTNFPALADRRRGAARHLRRCYRASS